jgi:hypothetical protein
MVATPECHDRNFSYEPALAQSSNPRTYSTNSRGLTAAGRNATSLRPAGRFSVRNPCAPREDNANDIRPLSPRQVKGREYQRDGGVFEQDRDSLNAVRDWFINGYRQRRCKRGGLVTERIHPKNEREIIRAGWAIRLRVPCATPLQSCSSSCSRAPAILVDYFDTEVHGGGSGPISQRTPHSQLLVFFKNLALLRKYRDTGPQSVYAC